MNEENGKIDYYSRLTKLPKPEPGSETEIVYDIVSTILNFMLNRHIHELSRNGYLKDRKYRKEGGWHHDSPQKALQLKFDLMDEAQERFTPYIIEVLKNYKHPVEENDSGQRYANKYS